MKLFNNELSADLRIIAFDRARSVELLLGIVITAVREVGGSDRAILIFVNLVEHLLKLLPVVRLGRIVMFGSDLADLHLELVPREAVLGFNFIHKPLLEVLGAFLDEDFCANLNYFLQELIADLYGLDLIGLSLLESNGGGGCDERNVFQQSHLLFTK